MADAATLLGWAGFYAKRRYKAAMAPAALPAPPIAPVLAKVAEALPQEPGFLFEPK